MTDFYFDNETQIVLAAGVQHLTNPLTGALWQNEGEAAEYFSPQPEIEAEVAELAEVKLTDIILKGAATRQVGDIHWTKVASEFTLTAKLTSAEKGTPLPDDLKNSELMVMCERVVDGQMAVDDMRFIASIKNGKVSLQGQFVHSGNYIINDERINRGLARIGASFRLVFDNIEFDAYL